MLFLWTTTELGKIWLDGDSFKQMIVKKLPKDFYCQEVSFIGEKNLMYISITLPDKSSEESKDALIGKLSGIFAKSGIAAEINWINVAPQDNPKKTPIWMLAIFWGGAAAAFVALVNLGFKGILWSIFAAVIGYGISWVFLTEDGQKQVAALMEQFRR